MSTEHDRVRDLLAAWAFGALPPAEAGTVPRHLAGCASCAAQAERLRETVRLLDGPPRHGTSAHPADRALPVALRARPAPPRTAPHAAPYAAAVAALGALLAEADGRWGTPVVHDWDVHATVAHLLAADEPLTDLLTTGRPAPPPRPGPDAGRAEAGPVEVNRADAGAHASEVNSEVDWADVWAWRSAEVIAREHRRDAGRTVAAWSAQAAALLATPEARDPGPAAGAVTSSGLRLTVADHFLVRAFETWIHTDDIGRALGLAVPPPPERHLWQLVRLAVRILGRALGPTAPPVLFSVTGGDRWVLGAEGEPVRAELTLDPVDFCLLVGGRHTPDAVPRSTTGDAAAVRNVLERAASLAWL
ncbi:maleylpyruvate isomerase family mycothiol-dependent enzyme [Streptomyces sp. NPDC002306]